MCSIYTLTVCFRSIHVLQNIFYIVPLLKITLTHTFTNRIKENVGGYVRVGEINMFYELCLQDYFGIL